MGNACTPEAGDSLDGLVGDDVHEVRVASTEILRVAGFSGFHTSIIIGEYEYFFDREGIMSAPQLWSHQAGSAKQPGVSRTEVIEMGKTIHDGRQLVQALHPFFKKGTYDLFYKNCNTFTDAALYFLTGNRLDSRFTRIERMITATNPVSTSLINRLFRAFLENSTGTVVDVDIYVTNPESQDFSIDDVIAWVDDCESDASDESDFEDDGSECSGTGKMGCCYQPRSQIRGPPLLRHETHYSF